MLAEKIPIGDGGRDRRRRFPGHRRPLAATVTVQQQKGPV
jgi:hypothetical protein